MDENLEAAIDRGRIDDRAVAGDDAGLFEPADPAQAWGRAEADPVREFGVGETALSLQLRENCAIHRIHSRKC